MRENYVESLLGILERAGVVAMDLLGRGSPALKADRSVVTRADMEISALTAAALKGYLNSGEHILIDEEDPEPGRYLDEAALDARPFIWALDPIDGTRPYANSLPWFGISLGLLKDRRPWIGGVLFPALDELFYCDGQDAWFVRHPFSARAKRALISPVEPEINDYSIFCCSEGLSDAFRWRSEDCHIIISACAVADLCWPVIGRGCGCLFRANLWDFAGAWPVWRKAGLELRKYSTGEEVGRIDLADYRADRRSWKLREFHILSTKKHFPLLQARIIRSE
jgi:myo-inositol-1(or 4)-monophosphatase